jgi:hypothetical protein
METPNSKLEGLIRLPDPDAPVYRIFSLWFFEELLRLKQLALVPPTRWEDPFEVLAQGIQMVDQSTAPWDCEMLEPYLSPAYAQCWSTTPESDTLLRAYSRVIKDPHFGRNTTPQDEGVKVRTTPHKLISVLQTWAANSEDRSCFVGSVRYGSREQILQELANLIGCHGPKALGHGKLRAELLLLKRDAFSHESEVRAICIDGRPIGEQSIIQVHVDPVQFIEEVEFDPRLLTFERREREAVARDLGYTGQFRDSGLYQGQLLEVVLRHGWKTKTVDAA